MTPFPTCRGGDSDSCRLARGRVILGDGEIDDMNVQRWEQRLRP
jgi:hypothetical protein